MRPTHLLSFVFVLLTVSAFGQVKTDKSNTGTFYTFQIEDPQENIDGYNLYVPKVCEAAGSDCPVLIFLQGGLGVGGEIDKIYNWALPKMLKDGKSGNAELDKLRLETFIVLMPHIAQGQFYQGPETFSYILEEINSNYNTNKEAVFLTGLSRGGHGTWGLADDFSFTAVAPVCGSTHGVEDFEDLTQTPIWVIHNTEDGVVSYDRSARAVTTLEGLGVTFYKNSSVAGTPYESHDRIFTSPDSESHDAWTVTYSSPEFYNWLLKYVD